MTRCAPQSQENSTALSQLTRRFCYALPMSSFGGKRKPRLSDVELYDYAVRSLARKMRTVAELKRLLRQRVEANEDGAMAVEVVIAKLKEQKYLNDSRYSASYSQYRQSNEKFGRRRVITDLKAKGVHSEIIQQAVDAAYEDVNEEQLARQFLGRKRLKKPQNERESARIFRTLVRAGFSPGTIFTLLKRWNVDDEVLTALSSESDESTAE
jgi:regulatory protein